MTSARDHLGHQDDRSPAGIPSRAPGHAAGPAISGPGDPRLAHGSPESELMHLQRTAGNAAVSALVAPVAQRVVAIDEVTSEVTTAPDATAPAGTGSGPVTSSGGATTISGSQISLDAPVVDAPGIVRANTIIADNVIGTNYSPGTGNMW